MFQTALRYLIASLLILSAACDTLGIEVRVFCGCPAAPSLSEALVGASRLSCVSSTQSPSIHLSSELDVGRDLIKACSSAVLEAGALCAGRQSYRLYAEPSSACTSYFWCAPGRGACLLTCAAGGCPTVVGSAGTTVVFLLAAPLMWAAVGCCHACLHTQTAQPRYRSGRELLPRGRLSCRRVSSTARPTTPQQIITLCPPSLSAVLILPPCCCRPAACLPAWLHTFTCTHRQGV